MAHQKPQEKDLYIAMTVVILGLAFISSNIIIKFVSAHSGILVFMGVSFAVISTLVYLLTRKPSSSKNQYHKLTLEPLLRTQKPKDNTFDFPDDIELDDALPVASAKPTEWTKELISSLEWKRFEQLCSEYLNAKGFQSKLTRCGADGGVDVRIFKDNDLYGVVQCKAYKSYKIGIKPVRELYGVMASENVKQGFFITSSRFTKEAVKFSNKNTSLKLVDGDLLLKRIKELPDFDQQTLLDTITDGDYTTPTCPSCDVKMVVRTSSKGKNKGDDFWGCASFPKCRQTFKYTD